MLGVVYSNTSIQQYNIRCNLESTYFILYTYYISHTIKLEPRYSPSEKPFVGLTPPILLFGSSPLKL